MADPKARAESDYLAGVSLVYRGRRLEEATRKLDEAVQLAPQNGEYRLALGCALVRRAAVIRFAYDSTLVYEKDRASYPQRQTTWEKAQSDSKSRLYNTVPPSRPVPPTTSDDDKAYTLTPRQAKDYASDLVKRAIAEWDAALAAESTDEKRANAQYVRGWGMIVIRRFASEFVQNPAGSPTFGQYEPWLDEKLIPDPPKIVEAFQSAINISPDNARYWQSLGDSYVSDTYPKLWSRDKAIAAYEKALKLDRRNATLWFQMYTLQQESDPAAATTAMSNAASANPSNSFYWYLLADLLLTPDFTRGLGALEKGNAGTIQPVSYTYAIPRILAPLNPGDTGIGYGIDGEYIYMLPRRVAEAVDAYLGKGDYSNGVATARAGVRFTDKVITLANSQTEPVIQRLAWSYVGSAIETSYKTLIKAMERAGDSEDAAKARAKMQELTTVARTREEQATVGSLPLP